MPTLLPVRALRRLAAFSAFALLASGCGTDPFCDPELDPEGCPSFQQIGVTVSGAGTGSGQVVAEDINTVQIDCAIQAGAANGPVCDHTFEDAGGGGSFRLVATPDAGSVFASWGPGSCSQVSGNICILDFSASDGDIVFTVVANFGLDPNTDLITLYNSTNADANMVVGSETPSASNNVTSHGIREVAVSTTVGTQVPVKAYVGGSQVASTTCTVTAAAWQGGSSPLVMLVNEGTSYSLICSDF
ncbi:MAG TPA: hypothetical protein VLT17_05540 [Gemmatimonadales bacterium]|nr:hypothetical protein [Gemmatimonadales bacterium]